jgi:hypothetical protein
MSESWLNGNTRNGTGVIIGTSVFCAGCGKDNGVITVIIPKEPAAPFKEPDYPFSPDDCPICFLINENWKLMESLDEARNAARAARNRSKYFKS